MIQGQSFLYFLHSEDYTFYYTDQWGNFQQSANPTPLNFSPVGWDAISIQWQRSPEFWGMDRTFTVPLDFVEDGAKIIKHIVYTFGTEAKLFMTVAKQHLEYTPTTYGFTYKPLYKGEPDWTTFSHDGPKATVNLIEGGLAKLVKANKDTVYEIPIDVPEAIEVQMTPINIKEKITFLAINIGENVNPSSSAVIATLQIAVVTNEGTSTGVQTQAAVGHDLVGFDLATNDDRWILKSVDQNTTVVFTGKISFIFTNIGGPGNSWVYFQKQDGTIYDIVPYAIRADGTYVFDLNVSIPLNPGDKVFVFFQQDGHSKMTILDTEFFASYFTRYKTTINKFLEPLYVFKYLVNKITDGKFSADSSLLFEMYSFLLTSGDALRLLPGAKLKTSLSDFFKWVDAEMCAGMGIVDGKLVIERREYWLEGETINLGEVSGLKINPAADLLFNTIKVGYANQTYDNVNGRDEFNNTLQFTTPVKSVSKSYDIISPYRGDSFGIEFTRINRDGKLTTDANTDNDVFVVKVRPQEGVRPIDRLWNIGATGLIDADSVYNIPISPKRMLLRHGWYIHSVLDKLDSGSLVFQTTEKNAELVAMGIVEKADVSVGTLPARKFLPWIFEFEAQTPNDYELLLEGTAIKKYSFTINGIPGLGIAMKSGVAPNDNKTQVFQLLADASMDLTKFIDYYE